MSQTGMVRRFLGSGFFDRFEQMARDHDAAPDKRRAVRPVEPETQTALWLCLSTLCRIGELRMTEWRHADFEAGTWFVPKENATGSRGKKRDHFVDLSPFALRQFRALHARTGTTRWCFPGRDGESHVDVKSVSEQVDDRPHRFKQRKALRNRRNDNSLVRLTGGSRSEVDPWVEPRAWKRKRVSPL